MPKRAKELTAIEVKRADRPGLHPAGGVAGLLLKIQPSGAKSWILRATVGNRRRDMGLGAYPEIGLAAARERAREARAMIRNGIDPAEHRANARRELQDRQGARITFDEAARRCIAAKRHEFRNPKHAKQWESTLAKYASPVIGRMAVSDVSIRHLVDILEPIWTTKTETATRLRGRIETVLSWATVSGYREGDNPARWQGNLDAVLAKPKKVAKVNHHRAIAWQDVPDFMNALRQREGMAARALEFLVLTAARSGEVRGVTWDEIDLQARTWTVPAERIKAGKEHQVPLSDAAMEILNSLPQFDGNSHVFAAARGGPLSDMSLSGTMKRMDAEGTPHGMRSTFRVWAAETTNYPREVCEHALAHSIPDKVEAAYRRTDLFDQRRQLMDEWAEHCN